jgi:hypothetical protein
MPVIKKFWCSILHNLSLLSSSPLKSRVDSAHHPSTVQNLPQVLCFIVRMKICTNADATCKAKHLKVKLSRYTPWRHMGGEEV